MNIPTIVILQLFNPTSFFLGGKGGGVLKPSVTGDWNSSCVFIGADMV